MESATKKNYFTFQPNDFSKTTDGTTWRARLGPILHGLLEERTARRFHRYSVYNRHEIYIYDYDHRENFVHAKLLVTLRPEEKAVWYGLYLEKGYQEDKNPNYVMDERWSWNNFLRLTGDERFFKRLVHVLSATDAEMLFNQQRRIFKAIDGKLVEVDLDTGRQEEVNSKALHRFAAGIPPQEWSDVYIGRTSAVRDDGTIDLEEILGLYVELLPILDAVLEEEDVFRLVGAAKSLDWLEGYKAMVAQKGMVASWWSYPINDDFLEKINELLSNQGFFRCLVYHAGKIVAGFSVIDYRTSKGSVGMVSPFPEYTLPEEKGREAFGDKRSEIPKTWLLVNHIEVYDPPLPLARFVTYKDNRAIGPSEKSALRNGFGYWKATSGVEPPRVDIYSYLSSTGLHFPPSLVTAYLLALKTKPFVILTGLTGTGKTRLALEVAKYYSSGDEGRYLLVPVRPDWTDNQGLLGFYNLITQRYEPTELLKLILRASEDTGNPYFLILDEMNLAKVEHYFSDFLSCLESGEPILLHDQPEDLPFSDGEREYLIPSRLELPPNLFVTGTVNVDETTYMFSPKVLDRAFTLEFDHVDASAYLGLEAPLAEAAFLLQPAFALLPQEKAERRHAEALSTETKELLARLEELLSPYRLHFGYRVLNEISLYLSYAREFVGDDASVMDTAFDFCILQKVLPKLHGNRAELEEPLASLLFFCFGLPSPEDPARRFEDFRAGDPPLHLPDGKPPRFPRAAAKIHRMWSALRTRGFVSFVE
ncbi:MAG: AAA family ATPase [Actinobacteria bacterium]|nr:AAA family ATPase [Actinomycetota bacterium]